MAELSRAAFLEANLLIAAQHNICHSLIMDCPSWSSDYLITDGLANLQLLWCSSTTSRALHVHVVRIVLVTVECSKPLAAAHITYLVLHTICQPAVIWWKTKVFYNVFLWIPSLGSFRMKCINILIRIRPEPRQHALKKTINSSFTPNFGGHTNILKETQISWLKRLQHCLGFWGRERHRTCTFCECSPPSWANMHPKRCSLKSYLLKEAPTCSPSLFMLGSYHTTGVFCIHD